MHFFLMSDIRTHNSSELGPVIRRPLNFGRRMANFASASSFAEQNFAVGLKCHDSTSA